MARTSRASSGDESVELSAETGNLPAAAGGVAELVASETVTSESFHYMDRDWVNWACTAATRCDERDGAPPACSARPPDWLTLYI
jgi:hypothetical protein